MFWLVFHRIDLKLWSWTWFIIFQSKVLRNIRLHSRHQQIFMNFHYSYTPLWVSRSHSMIDRGFYLYSLLWVSRPHYRLERIFLHSYSSIGVSRFHSMLERFFFTPIHPCKCQDIIVGLKGFFLLLFTYVSVKISQ